MIPFNPSGETKVGWTFSLLILLKRPHFSRMKEKQTDTDHLFINNTDCCDVINEKPIDQ